MRITAEYENRANRGIYNKIVFVLRKLIITQSAGRAAHEDGCS
jgi:hypothetical protein